jgi:hypothetical protein
LAVANPGPEPGEASTLHKRIVIVSESVFTHADRIKPKVPFIPEVSNPMEEILG